MSASSKNDFIDLHGVQIPRDWLEVHTLITGTTGSGKTRGVLRAIIQQTFAMGDAAVVVDVKGDLLPIVEEALRQCGREQDLVVLGIGPEDHVFNPLSQAIEPNQLANQIIMCSSLTGPSASDRVGGDDLFWASARNELLVGLLELARNLSKAGKMQEPLCFKQLQRLRSSLTQPSLRLKAWAEESAEFLSDSGASALQEFASYPDTTRSCVLSSVTNLLGPFLRRPLNLLVEPAPGRRPLDLHDVIDKSEVLVVTAGQAEYASELLPGFLMFKFALYKMLLSRARLPVRQDNRILVVADEYNRLVLSHDFDASEHVALESARSNRVSFVLAAQNLSGLQALAGSTLVDKIAALCGNLVFLSNNCPVTGRLAERCLGLRTRIQKHRSRADVLPPPLLIPEPDGHQHSQNLGTVLVPVQEPRVTAATLARLKPGQGYIKLMNGRVHKLKCTFN